jgi:hypothetical protein
VRLQKLNNTEEIMHSLRHFVVICVVMIGSYVGFPNSADADEEGRLPLAHMYFNSAGLDNSGPINIDALQDSSGISELKVSAFGKLNTVTKAQLAVIGGRAFNAMGASYSRGYAITGGRSVYVLLCQGFSSGMEVAAVVTVTERGDVRVKAIQSKSQ